MIKSAQIQKSRFKLNQEDVVKSLRDERANEAKETRLYDHQIDAVLSAVDYFNNPNRSLNIGLIQIPTGGGKSGIITMLPYALGSHKVMVLSPGREITKQLESVFGGGDGGAMKSFYVEKNIVPPPVINQFLPPAYAIKSSKQIPDMSIYELVIVNAQKFSRSAKPEIILNGRHGRIQAEIFENFDTVIVDEAHHYPANTWKDIIEVFNKNGRKILFLTATPNPDAESMYKKLFEISRNELEERQIIRKIEFEPLNFKDINNVSGAELLDLASKMKTTLGQQDAAVTNVFHKAMVLVKKDKAYTKEMAQRFTDMPNLDLIATYCISNQDSKANLDRFSDKKSDKPRIMVVCQKLTEGYDNPNVSMCVVLRNIGSDTLFNQFVGRCIRISHDRNNRPYCDVKAKVYAPQNIWERFDAIAITDPEDEDGDDD